MGRRAHLTVLLGRRRFGNGVGRDVVNWAADALLAGWESASLGVLAGLDGLPNEFEVDDYVERVLGELRVEMPDADRLARLYAVAIAADVVAGTTSPGDAAREMVHLWLRTGRPRDLLPWLSHDDDFVRASHEGDDADVEAVRRAIREEAQRVVERGV